MWLTSKFQGVSQVEKGEHRHQESLVTRVLLCPVWQEEVRRRVFGLELIVRGNAIMIACIS